MSAMDVITAAVTLSCIAGPVVGLVIALLVSIFGKASRAEWSVTIGRSEP